MAVALVAAVLSVSGASPASADHTGTRTVWSATLTVDQGSAVNFGCDTGSVGFDACSTASVLTDDDFTYEGSTYPIRFLYWNSNSDSLRLGFTNILPSTAKSALSGLTLHVGDSLSDLRQFAVADATPNDAVISLIWNNSGLSWSDGDTVRLRLTVDVSALSLPTLSASVSGDPVEGGEAVTLTLTLSEPVEEATSMQRRVSGTAAHYTPNPNPDPGNPQPGTPGDYDWIKIPTFPAGGTTATTQIRAVQDGEVEGCETITWVMTMWPGTYWAVRASYTIYIEDDDGGTSCSSLRAAAGGVVSGNAGPQELLGSVGDDRVGALAEPEPVLVLSPFVKRYDVNGNEVIDLVEYAQAGQDYGNKVITFGQFTEVKDAWLEASKDPAQVKELPNQPPTVQTAFDDVTLTGRGDSLQISTSGRFSDPDGHAITMIEAASSDHSVATVAMAADDSSLTVTGDTSGTATITVTAHDGHNGRVTDTFTVTVKAAPTVANPIADVGPLVVGGDDTVDLSGVFADADGDTLTFSVDSTDDFVSVALVRYAPSSELWVLAMGRGTAELTVTAQDSDGNETSDTFTVTVKEAPTVANPIADIASLESGKTKQISLSGVFADADGDTLTLSAASSDTDVATVLSQLDPVTGSATAITVTAVSSGTATITVTARDSDNNTVTDTFDVTVPAAQQQTQYQGGSSDNDSPQGDGDGAGDGLAEDFDPPTDEHALEEPIVLTPGAVHNLTLTATDNGGVRVSWDAPTIGSAPTRYIVHLRPEGGQAGSGKTKRPKAAKTQVTFNKLEPGTTYQVWVRAHNALGKGERTHATITLPTP